MKSKRISDFVLRVFIALLIGWAGLQKMRGDEASVEVFTQLDMEPFGRHLVGILELGAALLILFPPSIVAGATLTWGLMAGAALAHLTKLGFSGPSGTLFFAALAALVTSTLVLYQNRARSRVLKKMFHHRP
jgi:uncharacterized membrane protein YphA (DoxX/SURF4 family)